MSYVAPDPTSDQIANGIKKGYDPFDRAGTLPYWDMAADDTLAAAATIHDEMTLRGGPPELALKVAADFRRDCEILVEACDGYWRRIFEARKAEVFATIVWETASLYWRTDDLNTDVTRAQGEAQMLEAKRWINECARKIGRSIPYPEAA